MTTHEAVEIAALKTEIFYLKRDLDDMSGQILEMRKDLKVLTELVANAKGAKWMLIAMVSGAATIGALVSKALPYLQIMPKA